MIFGEQVEKLPRKVPKADRSSHCHVLTRDSELRYPKKSQQVVPSCELKIDSKI